MSQPRGSKHPGAGRGGYDTSVIVNLYLCAGVQLCCPAVRSMQQIRVIAHLYKTQTVNGAEKERDTRIGSRSVGRK